MENELLTKLYGEFCSMRGEMCEFKNRTLERLGLWKQALKNLPQKRRLGFARLFLLVRERLPLLLQDSLC